MKKWMWLRNNAELEKNFLLHTENIKQAGIDAILFSGSIEAIEKLIPITQKLKIELHIWSITGICSDPEIIKNHPDWFMLNRNGESCLQNPPYVDYYKWLCPSKLEVKKYLTERIVKLCSYPEIAGIHLDYIRYPDVILPVAIQPEYNLHQTHEEPQFDYCYCPECRQQFSAKTGIDPLDLQSPSTHTNWLKFRYDNITNLVNSLAKIVRPKLFSAAVFPTPKIAKELVRQDWTAWDIDAIFPMIYHKFYDENIEWIKTATKIDVQKLSSKTKLIPGLFLPHLTPDELPIAMQKAMESGANSIAFFDYDAEKIMKHHF